MINFMVFCRLIDFVMLMIVCVVMFIIGKENVNFIFVV